MPGRSATEDYTLALLLQYPELKVSAEDLQPEYFESSENREILSRWREASDAASLEEGLDAYLREQIQQLRRRQFPPGVGASQREKERTLRYWTLELRRKWLHNLRHFLSEERDRGVPEEELATLEQQVIANAASVLQNFTERDRRILRRSQQ